MIRKTIMQVFALCLFAFPAFSQLTVGSTAAPITGSVLDIESTNQGVLFPRVSLSATGTWGLLGTGTTGMVVYNTNAAITGTGAAGAGLYYWNNSTGLWNYIQSGASNYWSLTGNASTTPGTNYLGTSDAQSLYFKVDGNQAGYLQYAATAANANTAFGYLASASNSSTSVGAAAAASGTNSLAVGNGATANATQSTAIGYGASATASNATAIGNGATTAQANALVLGNSSVSVGIGTNTPAQSLEIGYNTGTVRIDGLKSGKTYNSSSTAATSTLVYSNNSTGDLYSLPTVNSATLGTNASGVPSWIPNTISAWQLAGNSGITQPAVPSTYGTSTFAAGENFVGNTDAKDLTFGTSNTERMRILSTGYIGIGTSTPNRQLVVETNHTNNVITVENTNAAGYSSIDMYDNTGNLASTFGYGNPSSVAPFTARGYFNQYQHDFVWMNTVNSANNPILFISGQSATPGWIGIQTVTPAQVFEVAPTTGTVRIDGLKSGNSFNSSSTASTSTILYSNNSTGDIYSLPTVNNATLVTNSSGVPSWSTTASGSVTHIVGTSGTPTYTAGTGAGTSPTITITGTDLSGKITVKVGSGTPAANAAIVTVNFNTAYSSAPNVVFSPGNANAAQLTANKPFINSTSTTNFVLESNTTALVAGTTYIWYYMVAQ